MSRSFALPLAFTLATLAHGQTAPQTTIGTEPGATASVHTLARPIVGTENFTAGATVLDFNAPTPGRSASSYANAFGLTFELFDGSTPHVWHDPAPRDARRTEPGAAGAQSMQAQIADGALRIAQTTPNVWPLAGPSFGEGAEPLFPLPVHGALEVRFPSTINRVGFLARSLDTWGATLAVTVLAGPRPVASWTFSGFPHFRTMGIESAGGFDTLRIDLVNPSTGALSLDNLMFEVDSADGDGDGVPNFIDTCAAIFNPLQGDDDGDGIGNVCDPYPADPQNDQDGDGIPAPLDNCLAVYNPAQHDTDGDGIGDVCDPLPLAIDTDGDGIEDPLDNCVNTFNPDQRDCDGDGVGDVCDPSLLAPANVNLTLARGENADVNERICLPPVPPMVDIVLAVDNTGSMGEEIALVKSGLVEAINKIETFLPTDLRFALVTFRDYPASYTSCGYNGTYGNTTDYPFRVDGSISDETPKILAGVNSMSATSGIDFWESYGRTLWEIAQPDSGINFRPGSARYVVLMGDALPHDCNVSEGTPCANPSFDVSGIDPGRDEIINTADDLDFHTDVMPALAQQFIRLVSIHSGSNVSGCYWYTWAELTNGNASLISSSAMIPQGLIARTMFKLAGSGEYDSLKPIVRPGSQLQIAFTPSVIQGPGSFNSAGGEVPFKMNVAVPSTLPAGVTSASAIVDVYADGALIGTQTINVTVQ